MSPKAMNPESWARSKLPSQTLITIASQGMDAKELRIAPVIAMTFVGQGA